LSVWEKFAMPTLFISYRRIDSAGSAGRLFDRLSQHFGREHVFMDTEGGIERGADFPEVIEKALASATAMVVVIGPRWISCADAAGQQRLQKSDDWVRNEIASALRRDIPVLPVFVDGAVMPAIDALPEDLRRLARKHASEISSTRWDYDVGQIIEILERTMPAANSRSFVRRNIAVAVAVAVLAAAGISLFGKDDAPALRNSPALVGATDAAALGIKGANASAAATSDAEHAYDLRGYWRDEGGELYKIVDRDGDSFDMGRVEPPETHPIYRIAHLNKREVKIDIGVLPSGTQQQVANLGLSVDGNILVGLLTNTQVEEEPSSWVLRREPDPTRKPANTLPGRP
jgi:hypothetical protein